MISSLRGKVQHKQAGWAIVDIAGIGYQVTMPNGTFSELPEIGGEVFLFTYLHVREDLLQLYGFSSLREKNIFLKLISISNIGPKVALSILSTLSVDDLTKAITLGDLELITTIPGIGKKTAQRLVLELKETLIGMDIGTAIITSSVVMAARDALLGMGFAPQEANQALNSCDDGMKLDECIKTALKNLGG